MQLQQIDLTELKPSPFNPRTFMDEAKFQDLVRSVEQGLIEPIIARKVDGHFEIVAGERRYRAAKKAKLGKVPVIVKDLSDAAAMEMQLIENIQREDMNPVDEAAGFERLMKLDPKTYTAETLATKIGLSAASVYLKLQVNKLTDAGKALLREGKIDTAHGAAIGRLSEADQSAALKWMAQEAKYHDGTFPNVKRLREWIKQNVRLDLFGPELATTQPKVHAKLAKLQAEGITPVQISGHWQSKDGVLGTDSYKEAGKQKCKSTEVAFLVYGDEVEVVEICRDKKACKTHYKWEVEQATARRRQLGRDKETPEKKKRRLAAEAKVKAANAVYKDVVQRALRAAIKRTKKVTPAMLTRLVLNTLDRYNFDEDTDQLLADLKIPQKALGLSYDMLRKGDLPRLSEQQLAALVILAEGDAMEFPNNAPDLDAFCKRHKLDLKKLKADALAAAAKAKESEPQKLTAPKKK